LEIRSRRHEEEEKEEREEESVMQCIISPCRWGFPVGEVAASEALEKTSGSSYT
jgi:hypothetical protein